jgi:site-specific recombinase XerD
MGSRRVPLQHPLAQLFQRTAESLTTSLGDSSIDAYQSTVHLFLTYLTAHHPQVSSLEQLRRDPHILGWLTHLRSRTPSLARYTMIARIVRLRRVLEELAWTQQLPTLAHLLGRDDIPRRDHHLPRPLTPDQDQRIQQELRRRDDFTSNALLLLRHTGMRIGECVDLSVDCLRVDSVVCQIIDRLRSLRLPPTAPDAGRLLLPRPRGRYMLTRKLRAALQDVAATAGITARIVPHQFRHTYATEMLRAGVGLPAVMKLLGHKSPRMTLYYLEITQQDLQREYRLARSHPRHLAPPPRVPSSISMPRADLAGLIDSLHAAQHVLEMFRRSVADTSANRILGRLANRLIKIVTEATNLNNLKTPGK